MQRFNIWAVSHKMRVSRDFLRKKRKLCELHGQGKTERGEGWRARRASPSQQAVGRSAKKTSGAHGGGRANAQAAHGRIHAQKVKWRRWEKEKAKQERGRNPK
jgi:hypothetical protein